MSRRRWGIAEANAVNTVISRLVGRNFPGADTIVEGDRELVDAVRLLAERAHDAIGSGWHPDDAAAAVQDRAGQQLADDLGGTVREAVEFEDAATRGVLARLDGDVLLVAGEEWTADVVDEPVEAGSRIVLERPDGVRRLVEVQVYAVGQQRPAAGSTPVPAPPAADEPEADALRSWFNGRTQ